MAELFELTELVTYMQVPSLPTDIATLAREMATAEIRRHVGRARFALLTADERLDLKGIALQLAKRACFNPEGLRSEKIDDYAFTIAAEDLLPPELTASDEARIDRILGVSGAHSIAPKYPSPTYNREARVYRAPV